MTRPLNPSDNPTPQPIFSQTPSLTPIVTALSTLISDKVCCTISQLETPAKVRNKTSDLLIGSAHFALFLSRLRSSSLESWV